MSAAKRQEPSSYPLTSAQLDVWRNQVLHPSLPHCNIGARFEIPAGLDAAVLERAVNLLVQRHDALRIQLIAPQRAIDPPRQVFRQRLRTRMRVKDLSRCDQPLDEALAWMQARLGEPFELYGGPLFRFDLVRVGTRHSFLLMQYHRLIADGTGVALLTRSLAGLYGWLRQRAGALPKAGAYRDVIARDQDYLNSPDYAADRDYWRDRFRQTPRPLLAPRGGAPFGDLPIACGCASLYLPRAVCAGFRAQGGLTEQDMLALWLAALYRYFGLAGRQDGVCIGLAQPHRQGKAAWGTAGMLSGISPVWLQFAEGCQTRALLEGIQARLRSDSRHGRFPLQAINRMVFGEGNRRSLFDVALSYRQYDYDLTLDGVQGRAVRLYPSWSHTPLVIYVQDFHAQADIKVDLVFKHAYFSAAQANALGSHLLAILEQIVTGLDQGPELPVGAPPRRLSGEALKLSAC